MTRGGISTAAVLAGGLGTRLRAAVSDRPKVLAPVAGRPFLAWWLDRLAAAGIERTVLCTGFRADEVRSVMGLAHGRMQLVHSPEPSPLGTGGALRLALPQLGAGPVLACNGDSWCGIDLNRLALAPATPALLTVVQVADGRRYGQVELGPHDLISKFGEKDEAAIGPAWINAGVYLFDRATIADIPSGRPVSLEREVLPALVGRGLRALRTDAPFIDIGTPESYAAAAQVLRGSGT